MVAEQVALARERGRRARARGRHRGDPRRRQPRRVPRRRCEHGERRGPRRRGGGAAGLPRRHADARPATCPATSRSSTSAAARPRSPSARSADGVQWCASFRVGSGCLADAYLHTDPPSLVRAARRARARRRRVRRARRARRPTARSRSAAAPPRCAGWSAPCSSPTALRRALRRAAPAPGRRRSRARSTLDPERVRLLPAGLLILDAAAAAARPAAADRPRRAARGRPARPGSRGFGARLAFARSERSSISDRDRHQHRADTTPEADLPILGAVLQPRAVVARVQRRACSSSPRTRASRCSSA